MAIVKQEVDVAKELDDVLVLVVGLVKDLKAGVDAGTVVSKHIPDLLAALSGVDQVGAEIDANKAAAFGTVGFRMGELLAAITG